MVCNVSLLIAIMYFPIELEFVTKLKPQSIVMPLCTVSIIKNVVHNITNITQQV